MARRAVKRIPTIDTNPRPHLSAADLSARWKCAPGTIIRNWRKLGLKPMHIGKRLIFTLDNVEQVEREQTQ